MKKTTFLYSICFLLVTVNSSFSKDLILRLQWVPQAQFAGYYMAEKKGYYKDEGLSIIIKPTVPGISHLRELVAGSSDFVTAWLLSGIQLKANGDKIVLISQYFQKPALMLLTLKSSNIDSVKKFKNKTMGVWEGEFQVLPMSLIRKFRIRNIKVTPQGFSMKPFVEGKLEIASAMRYNEYYQILEMGLTKNDIYEFDYGKLGIKVPEDGLYVKESFYQENKDECRKFLNATRKGWEYAFKNKKETVRYISDIANLTEFKTTIDKQMWMLNTVEAMMVKDTIRLKKKDFETASDLLYELKIISVKPSYETFFMDVLGTQKK